VDYEKLLENLNELPWRGIFIILAVSFVIASAVSNVFSLLLIPQAPPAAQFSGRQAPGDLPSGSLTITDSDIKKICDRNLFNKDESCPGIDEKSEETAPTGPEIVK